MREARAGMGHRRPGTIYEWVQGLVETGLSREAIRVKLIDEGVKLSTINAYLGEYAESVDRHQLQAAACDAHLADLVREHGSVCS